MAGVKQPSPYDDVSEKDWQQQVLDLLGYNGWKTMHVFDSRRSVPGWPDVFALHPRSGDRLVAELKTEKGKATPAQLEWLAWFEVCGIDAVVWKPSMVDEVIARVTKSRGSPD